MILSDDIRFLTNRALWEMENLMKCIPEDLWNKRYDGLTMWKYLYHTLYSMDRWYMNPCDSAYKKPENCDISRFRLILGQFRHWHRHMRIIYGFIVADEGKWPYVLNRDGKYPEEPMPNYY